jgi:3-oxoadipate enol-lactonase
MLQHAGQSGTHWVEFGSPTGAPVVFAHGLAADSRIWRPLLTQMKGVQNCRVITYDLLGHGQSAAGSGKASMGSYIRQAEQLLDHLELRGAVFIGHGFGGMVAQGLAIKRLDQIRALALMNTAAKLGTNTRWTKDIQTLQSGSSSAPLAALWDKWFSRAARGSTELHEWREMLDNVNIDGYVRSIEALSGTDLYTPISGLSLPTLGISSYNDLLFPPDLMRETVDIISGSEFHILPRAGHMAMIESPEPAAGLIDAFLTRIAHDFPT